MSRPPVSLAPAARLAHAYLRIALMACVTHAALLLFDLWHGAQNVWLLGSALLVSVVTAALIAGGRVPLHWLTGGLAWVLPVWLVGVVAGSAVRTGSVPPAYFLALALVTAVLHATLPGRLAARVSAGVVLATAALVLGWAPAQTPLLVYAAFLSGLIAFLSEHGVQVHAERQQSDALRALAVTDPLTGLLNRRGGMVALARLLEDARLGSVAVLLLDIDRFKSINDRFGHAAGDEVLLDVARAVQAAAGADVTAARWGGEEFLLMWPTARPAEARAVADRVVHAVRGVRVSGGGPSGSISAGLAFSTERPGVEALVNLADGRMYEAKQAGGDRWQGEGRGVTGGVSARVGSSGG
ncbi:GGDEF domain-containing protein [Deinococcus sedimenti]|uniref:GGDEF domain-containing protein n=1 Tax=Deinococcus sedimenti TaxID=1867090 RepID=A0ABQ2S908_9DEIO|nr:GGDEF domain-containing protein [Deinococcus sedimenti]GGR98339.1 hypothetical protein GCM10008960_26210 [Deinococcus sedimenti]